MGGLHGGQVVDHNEALLLLLGVIWLGAYVRKHPYFLEIPTEGLGVKCL